MTNLLPDSNIFSNRE